MSHFNDSLFMFLDNHYTELVIISGNEPYEINYLFDPQTKKGAFQFISKSENSEDMDDTEGIPDQILYNEFLKECQLKAENFDFFENQSIMYQVFDKIKKDISRLINQKAYDREFEFDIGIVIMD